MKSRILLASLIAALMVSGGARAFAGDPPRVTITPTASLAGTQRVAFNEDVHNVSAQNLFLRVHGDAGSLVTRITCLDAGGTKVLCETGVRSVLARGQAPLVPGQMYDIVVNPEGVATPIVDDELMPAPLTVRTFRASVTEQETSVAARAAWRKVTTSSASGGSYRVEHIGGALARFNFTGTGVSWFTRRAPSQGKASVSIDGKRSFLVNNYSATVQNGYRRSFTRYADGTPLADGRHYILIRVRGEKGHRSATGTSVSIDRFRVDGVVTQEPTSYSLARKPRSGTSGGYVARTDAPTASIEFSFWGRGIDWTTVTGPAMGKASIYIDSKLVKKTDNYSSTTRTGVRRSVTGLDEGLHRLKVVVLEERNARSRGRYIEFDRWQLRATITDFRGHGAWIDQYDYTDGTTRDTIRSRIATMRSHKVRTLFLETGTSFTNGFKYPTAVLIWVQEAHAAGLKVVGWFVPYYGKYYNSDVAKIEKIGFWRGPAGERFDGLAIDIEAKASGLSQPEWMRQIAKMLARVRSDLGIVYPIGAITFAPLDMDIRPDFWEGFPWESIGKYANVVMPMAYWSNRLSRCHGTGSFDPDPRYCAYEYTKQNIARSRAYTGLPVNDIGGVAKYCSKRDSNNTCTAYSFVTVADTYDYVRAAKEARAYGGGMYDYATTQQKPSLWTPLEGLASLG